MYLIHLNKNNNSVKTKYYSQQTLSFNTFEKQKKKCTEKVDERNELITSNLPCVKRVASAFRSGGMRTSRENEITKRWEPFTVKRDSKQKIPSPGNLSSAFCSNDNRLTEHTRMQAEQRYYNSLFLVSSYTPKK